MRYADRRRAGEALGEAVTAAHPHDPVVYALPRGGVPVGFEVAHALGCRLDVLLVRKIGVPFQPELAMGAIAEGGVSVVNQDVVARAGISAEVYRSVVARETSLLKSRAATYREVASPVSPVGHTAIVVDDGLATGSSALVALAVLRGHADAVWLAVPVAPADTVEMMEREFDRVIVVAKPGHFGSVGSWYRDFSQVSDDEVRDLLFRSRLA